MLDLNKSFDFNFVNKTKQAQGLLSWSKKMKLPNIKEICVNTQQGFDRCLAKISVLFALALMAVSSHAKYDFEVLVDNGQSAEDVADNADTVMKIIFNVIKGIAVVVGLWLVYVGIMRIKKANEPNSQTTPTQGILYIALGGCLGALPFIFLSSATIVQG